jgi:hypothetical protein
VVGLVLDADGGEAVEAAGLPRAVEVAPGTSISAARSTSARMPGMDRQPSRPMRVSGEDQTISGSRKTIGAGSPSLHATSMTKIRFITPTCGPARPRPGAAYIVSSMSAARRRNVSSGSPTGAQGVDSRGSGQRTMGRTLTPAPSRA